MCRPCIIIGCGSHSVAVISIVENATESFKIMGVVDTEVQFDRSEQKSGYQVIASLDKIIDNPEKYKHLNCILALGNNEARKIVYHKLKSLGLMLPNVVSNSAFVDRTAVMGDGNIISHGVIINSHTVLGGNNLINTRTLIEHHCNVASHIHLAPGVILCGGVAISDLSFLGAGAVVIPNLTLSSGSTLGAGSVLTSNISKKQTTYIGVPAKELT